MEKKSLMQDIADALSSRDGFQRKSAEAFCRLFFDVIEEGLRRDKFVKIKGFGTFKLVPVSERESINVNTGERIQIGSHTKITFTPDASIRDLVNKPFAHFQTTVLNEETELEELEEANAMMPFDETSATEEQENEAENLESTAEKQEETAEEQEGTLAEQEATAMSPTTDTSDEEHEAEDDNPTEEDNREEHDETADVATPEEGDNRAETASPSELEAATETETEVTDNSEHNPATAQTKANDAGNEGETSTEHIEEKENNVMATETTETLPISGEINTSIDEDETSKDEEETQSKESSSPSDEAEAPSNASSGQKDTVHYVVEGGVSRRSPNWWKIIALFLFVLILMGLSYFAGYYKVFCPPCETNMRTALVPAPQPDTLTVCKPAAKDASSLAAQPAMPKKDSIDANKKPIPAPDVKEKKPRHYNPRLRYDIVGTHEVHIVASGENLYSIAAKAYGNKKFASYIIRHNNLRNPDNIVIGAKLKLPELALPDSKDTAKQGDNSKTE